MGMLGNNTDAKLKKLKAQEESYKKTLKEYAQGLAIPKAIEAAEKALDDAKKEAAKIVAEAKEIKFQSEQELADIEVDKANAKDLKAKLKQEISDCKLKQGLLDSARQEAIEACELSKAAQETATQVLKEFEAKTSALKKALEDALNG
jgi:DNA repair exonuclease SbcCD ATPase subunit